MELVTNWKDTIVDLSVTPNAHLDENGCVKPGIYRHLDNDEYHALDGISSSMLKTLHKQSPVHVQEQYFSGKDRHLSYSQKKTFEMGSLAHEIVLEHEAFYERYYPLLDINEHQENVFSSDELKVLCEQADVSKSGTKAQMVKRLNDTGEHNIVLFDTLQRDRIIAMSGQEAVDKAEQYIKEVAPRSNLVSVMSEPNIAKYAKQVPIDKTVWDSLHELYNTVLAHPLNERLLEDGEGELSCFAICPMTEMMVKCRFDWISYFGVSGDLKTTQSTKPQDMRRQALQLGYHLQEAHYTYVAGLCGIHLEDFIFIGVEFRETYWCEIYRFSDNAKRDSRHIHESLLEELSQCIKTAQWHGYQPYRQILTFEL